MAFNAYDYLRDELLRRRRAPMDERLPDGSTVQDLLRRTQDPRPIGTPSEPRGDPGLFGKGRGPTLEEMEQELNQRLPDGRTVREIYESGATTDPVTGAFRAQTGSGPTGMTRPRRVFEQPPQPGNAGRPRFTNPITYDTSGMPERRPHNYGNDPMDTAIRHREALENWRPSGERSLGNVARGAGYGALTAAQQFPGNPEAMIGASIAGLLGTLIKPETKNYLRRGLAIPQADAEVARQLKLAGDQAKLRQAEINPFFREQTLNQGQQRIDLNRDRMAQQNLLTHKRALASIFNAYPEFDPEDPKNAAIVAAMNAVGLPVTKKTRGSLLQLVQGTDAEGNATFSIVHKPSGTASQVTGTGLPAKTEQQFGREASQERTEYTQEQINARERSREREGGFTPIQQQGRIDKAAELHAEVTKQRELAKRAARAQANAVPGKRASIMVGNDPVWADEALENALQAAQDAASRLRAGYSDLYEAGEGEADQSGRRWAYSKPREGPSDLDRPIYPNPTGGKYAGQRFSRAKVHERAKKLGMSPEQAEREITKNGGTLY